MFATFDLRKTVGVCLAAVSLLLVSSLPGAAGQGHPGAAAATSRLPASVSSGYSHPIREPGWSVHQTIPALQPCGAGLTSFGPEGFSDSTIWGQPVLVPWTGSTVRFALGGPDIMSLFGYDSQVAWWWNGYVALNPALASCAGFQMMPLMFIP